MAQGHKQRYGNCLREWAVLGGGLLRWKIEKTVIAELIIQLKQKFQRQIVVRPPICNGKLNESEIKI